jgi:hypothetical protein
MCASVVNVLLPEHANRLDESMQIIFNVDHTLSKHSSAMQQKVDQIERNANKVHRVR